MDKKKFRKYISLLEQFIETANLTEIQYKKLDIILAQMEIDYRRTFYTLKK